jgi:uncharacterized protein
MVFKRRDQPSLFVRVREAIYPRKGWRRGIDYYTHRIKRIPDTPHKIAIGIAAGIFVSFTPFLGLHLVLGGLLAWALRGNIVAGVIATFSINPITLPAVAALAMWCGQVVFGLGAGIDPENLVHTFNDGFVGMWQIVGSFFGFGTAPWEKLAVFWTDLLIPYLVGGIIPGLIFSAAAYFLAKPVIAAYQKRRRAKLAEKANERRVAKQTKADQPT